MDASQSSETEADFDLFAHALHVRQSLDDAGTMEATSDAGTPLVGIAPLTDYSETQHRIQLSDQVHVDIPDDMLSDAQAHLWKNGFPNMNRTDAIAALLRSGAVTQGVPIEGSNDFYREHGIIPNAQAADLLRNHFREPRAAPKEEDTAAVSPPHLEVAELRDQHDTDRSAMPEPGALMQAIGGGDHKSDKEPETDTPETGQPDTEEAVAGNPQESQPSGNHRPVQDTGPISNGGGRGFSLPGMPNFGLRSFIESRGRHAARLENTRLDMAMDAARESLKGIDHYLPSSELPDGDRTLLYAERLKNDPEAYAAHYKMIGRFSRLQDTVKEWTDAAKDNPALQKVADTKIKAVDDLMKSGQAVPDATFRESMEKIAKAISEMFSRIFQKLGIGKSAEAGM